ncbi:hypothetical protein IRZ71_00390 [Flavobacterium sp. ANB]|uniref:hypothetical protein n=1 Tax=unclassified Flavobacterium TaxID=196869 RepID=UPI0012B7913F|nr:MULTISPECIES: hypothetical protein [unclassified Flavobacterium]MBF4514778.1 hypothetical protein [Flavobacterium sp. ANB]MTD68104.1 hypothetical protein [Flavobacterium sp. LC2016-13]
MILKIIHSGLFLFVVFMGIKQGYSMISGSPEIVKILESLSFNKTEILLFGIVTLLSGILIFHPKTFLAGNFIMFTTILLLIVVQIQNQNLKGAVIEIPFLLMNIFLVYLKYPFSNAFLN